jgi:Fe-S oxidoreductase
MFKDAEKGEREVNVARTDDVLAADAKVVATGCPFCNTMMTDGVKLANREDIEVKDIAELIAEAADLI